MIVYLNYDQNFPIIIIWFIFYIENSVFSLKLIHLYGVVFIGLVQLNSHNNGDYEA